MNKEMIENLIKETEAEEKRLWAIHLEFKQEIAPLEKKLEDATVAWNLVYKKIEGLKIALSLFP